MVPAVLNRQTFEERLKQTDIVYAVLDPVAWPDLTPLLSQTLSEYVILYEGRPADDLLPYLPRLVRISYFSELLKEILNNCGKGQGIFLFPHVPETDWGALAQHCARLCNAVMGTGEFAWIRWYDPYVLNVILSRPEGSLHETLFGAHIRMVVAEKNREDYLSFAPAATYRPSATARFSLTPDLLEALDEGHYRLFLQELFYHCHALFYPGTPFLEETVKQHIEQFCDVAQHYGLTSMADITRFVELAIRTQGRSALTPEAQEFLKAYQGSSLDRLSSLQAYCRQQNWLPSAI